MSVERRDQREALSFQSPAPNRCSPCLAPNIKFVPLSWDVGKLSPSISCLTADYRETCTSTSQLPKRWVALLINPKSELPAFPGLCTNMLPPLPGAALLCGGRCSSVLSLATEAGRHKSALIQEPASQNPHQNLQTAFNSLLKMNLYQGIFRQAWPLTVKKEALKQMKEKHASPFQHCS